jgi:hypothetical protein
LAGDDIALAWMISSRNPAILCLCELIWAEGTANGRPRWAAPRNRRTASVSAFLGAALPDVIESKPGVAVLPRRFRAAGLGSPCRSMGVWSRSVLPRRCRCRFGSRGS